MARTQKNKATSYHLGLLKAKLAKLRRELITPSGGGGVKEDGAFTLPRRARDAGQDSTWPRRVMRGSALLVRDESQCPPLPCDGPQASRRSASPRC